MKFTATTTTNDLVFKLEEKSKHIYYIEKKEENKTEFASNTEIRPSHIIYTFSLCRLVDVVINFAQLTSTHAYTDTHSRSPLPMPTPTPPPTSSHSPCEKREKEEERRKKEKKLEQGENNNNKFDLILQLWLRLRVRLCVCVQSLKVMMITAVLFLHSLSLSKISIRLLLSLSLNDTLLLYMHCAVHSPNGDCVCVSVCIRWVGRIEKFGCQQVMNTRTLMHISIIVLYYIQLMNIICHICYFSKSLSLVQ